MDVDITQKQAYLYKQIIEGGYNPEEFQQYLFSKNPQLGDDIGAWPMIQLQNIVQQFIKKIKLEEQESEVKQENNEEEKVQEKSVIEQTKSPIQVKDSKITYQKHQNYTKTMNCVVIKKSSLFDSFNEIKIRSYEKRQGGIFQKSYVIYKIQVSTLKSSVERRYSDFEWLRQILSILHPGIPLPPLAKKGKMRRYDDKHLMKRMFILQKFLCRMNQIPDIRADETFENFLKINNAKEFEKEKAKYKKLKEVPLQKIQNVTGTIDLVLDQSTNTLVSRSQKYMSVVQPEVKKVYKDFKGAATMLQNCSNFLNNISKNCDEISKNENKFRKEAQLTVKPSNIYAILSQMARKYAGLLAQQAKTFRKQVYALVKYESLQMLNMVQEFGRLGSLQKQFLDKKKALMNKKQKLFDEGNMGKWGLTQKISNKPSKEEAFLIMLPKETKELLKLRDSYALLNSQISHQLRRQYRQNNEYLSRYLQEIANSQSDLSSRNIMIWADVLTRIKGMREQLYI